LGLRLKGAILPPGDHGQAPRSRARETDLRNISGSKRLIKELLRFDGRAFPKFVSGTYRGIGKNAVYANKLIKL
jgi:hypothetical protein